MSLENRPPLRYAFVDTETTGLDPRRHEVWEVAVILRDPAREGDQEWRTFLPVQRLDRADAYALRVGGYWERHPDPLDQSAHDVAGLTYGVLAARWLADNLRGAVLMGFNPAFDAAFLTELLRTYALPATWHYAPCDVGTMVGASLGFPPPYSTNELLEKLGVTIPDGARHTAMGDARAAADLFDAWWEQTR